MKVNEKQAKEFVAAFSHAKLQQRKRKKKLQEQQQKETAQKVLSNLSNVAPTKATTASTKKSTYFDKGAFSNGRQRGDVAKTILGTLVDVGENVNTAVIDATENLIDTTAAGLGWTVGLFKKGKKFKEKTGDFIAKDLLKSQKVGEIITKYGSYANAPAAIARAIVGDNVEEYSVLGDKSDSLVQAASHVVGQQALARIGVPSAVTSGVNAFGSQMEAKLQEGKSFDKAFNSGLINAGAEIITEKIGGIKYGGKALTDIAKKTLGKKIASKVANFFINAGMDAASEGFEELLSYAITSVGDKLVGASDKEWNEIFSKDEALDNVIGGVLLGAGGNVVGSVNAKAQGVDAVTGLTKNEQSVVQSVYDSRLADMQKNGKKVSALEKNKLWDDITNEMRRGELSTDDIERVLGGDTYNEYKSRIDRVSNLENNIEKLQKEHDELNKVKIGELTGEQQDRLAELKKELPKLKSQLKHWTSDTKAQEVADLKNKLSTEVYALSKGTNLAESYYEVERRKQTFSADLSQYNEKEKAIVQKAIDSGIINNTNRSREFVDLVARLAAAKDLDFDFTTSKRLAESGFAIDGVTINGMVDKNTKAVTINMNSAKALETVVGHEITHILENTDLYDALAESVKQYATTKGEYDTRLEQITELYKNDQDADVVRELTADLVGDYIFSDADFVNSLTKGNRNLAQKILDEIVYMAKIATAGSKEKRQLEKAKKMLKDSLEGSGEIQRQTQETNTKLNEIGLYYDSDSDTVSYSLSSLEDAFNYETDENGLLINENDYVKARDEYVSILAKSIAVDKGNPTQEEIEKANRYLDGLFLVHDMIAKDKDRLDYEAAVNKSAWVSNSEYGGSIDFSTLCAKRRLFTGTFDAIQEALPDTVLTDKDFLNIRNLLLESDQESPCSMCYVEGSRANHGKYVDKWLKEYLKTNPEWKPQIADFTSTTRLEQTRISHREAYAEYVKAMNKLSQRKPKEASVRTDYKGEILVEFADGSSVEIKNKNGGIRFNSFSDFEIIHALDCMQVITDMARVGLNGQAYTKVKEFAEAFGNTGLKINLSLVAKGVDENGKLIMDEVNGMKYAEAIDIRKRYSDNVGTVVVVFTPQQLEAALADNTIDFVLPFHRSQWRKAQYALMGLPEGTKDFTNAQNDRIRNPKTGRPVKLSKIKHISTYTNDMGETFEIKDNIMPNQYWDFNLSGRENANRYLDYINANGMTPKFDFVLDKVDGKWVLPDGAVGDGYFKLLIDFKMYNNEGIGSPQNPVLPEFNMPYIQDMLSNYIGGHKSFPVAHDVVDKFVEGKKNGRFSLSSAGTTETGRYMGKDIALENEVANVEQTPAVAPTKATVTKKSSAKAIAPLPTENAPKKTKVVAPIAKTSTNVTTDTAKGKQRSFVETATKSDAVGEQILPEELTQGKIYYEPISNKKTLEKANSSLNKLGYDEAIKHFDNQFNVGRVTLEDIVLGERLIQESLKKGDTVTAGKLIEDVAILGTELGRKVQALSIIQRLTPEGQLRMLNRTIERAKTKLDKQFKDVEITQEMKDRILSVYDENGNFEQDALNEAMNGVIAEIADKMKTTVGEKANAWRYLSMLGNIKTHGRNMISNLANAITIAGKNAVARTIETGVDIGAKVIGKESPFEYRTKIWKRASQDVKDFAEKTVTEERAHIQGDDISNVRRRILAQRKIFGKTFFTDLYNFNSKLLQGEDWMFSKFAYKNAFAEFLTANGIKTQADIENNKKLIDKAKDYALDRARIATFQQDSWLANKISEIENKNLASKIAVGAVVPFKKTPINVAKAGFNYSPLGVAKTITYDAVRLAKGEITANTYIDNLSQGFTGSALVFVGYLLASKGILNGAGDDDKEGKYDYQLGEQRYSITVGKNTYTLNWLSPTAMPLFVGANMFEQFVEKREFDGNVVLQSIAQVLDPMSDMSFLSSLNDALSSYDSGIMKFVGIFKSMSQNYITQYIPTALSQTAAMFDDTKRTTKASKTSSFRIGDETMRKIMYKIPGLRNMLEPVVDIWGNEVKQDERVIVRALDNYIMPYSKKYGIATNVDTEIKELYQQTGDTGLIPSVPYDNIKFKGTKYDMSAKEFTEYKKNYGQTAHDLMAKLFDTNTYKNSTKDEQADMVNRVYDYARDEAKRIYLLNHDVNYTNATKDNVEIYREDYIKGAIDNDMPVKEYEFMYNNPEKYEFFMDNGITFNDYDSADEDGKRAYSWAFDNPTKYMVSKVVTDDVIEYKSFTKALSEFKADEKADGTKISGSAKRKKADYINSLDIDYGAKIVLYKGEYMSDNSYNRDIVNYLISRDDLSYQQVVTILEELDMKVTNGRVSW